MLTDCTNAAVVKRKRKKREGKKKRKNRKPLPKERGNGEGGAEWRVKLDKERLPL